MKITAVIPAYNAEKHIARAIDSVLAQTRPADEVIVVDDGSTDGTAEIVRSYGDKVIFIQQENAGVSVARNTGIEAATSEWVAFLDADDEWLPEKLKLQTEHLARHPDLKWTYANFYQKTGQETLRITHISENTQTLLQEGEVFQDYLQGYINHTYAWTSTLLIHRSVFNESGLFRPGMKIAQDTDLWFRIAYVCPTIGYLSEPLAIYHLDTPGSSMKVNNTVDFMINFLLRHEEISQQYNRYDAFARCRINMLCTWLRQLECESRRKDAKVLFAGFREHLPRRFRREMRFRLWFPVLGTVIANLYLDFKRRRKK